MDRGVIVEETTEILDEDPDSFQEGVAADAEVIKDEVEAGTFNNPQGIIGLEYEFYAVSDKGSTSRVAPDREPDKTMGTLMRVPRNVLSYIGFEKELGLHNAEMNTSPQPMNPYGLNAQYSEVSARLSAALQSLQPEGIRLVSDGMFTIPPPGETASSYLTDSVEDQGVRIATNMSDSARYHAMANTDTPAGMQIDAPNVHLEADTVMPESLITSIQPHYQVPHADDLPSYFDYAVRIAGPLLALGVNSPFFPPDLYDADASPRQILDEAWLEHRISVFETSLNTAAVQKVRFPRDLSSTEEAVDRIVEDETFVPLPVETGDRFEDRFAYFRAKHGTYWRWVRPVFGGSTRASAHARIEFRPIAAQPTVLDSVSFQAAFAGLLERMHADNHPVRELDWEDAKTNFYAAMKHGLEAELSWITSRGEPTMQRERIFQDILETAADGLRARNFSEAEVGKFLGPLRGRSRLAMTPGRWKLKTVGGLLNDGAEFSDAVTEMQREYINRQRDSLFTGSFTDWIS